MAVKDYQNHPDGKPPLVEDKLRYLPPLALTGGALTAIDLVRHNDLWGGMAVIAGSAAITLVLLIVCILISRCSR